MEEVSFFACSEFWKDVKKLGKHIRSDFLDCPFSNEELEKLSCQEKVQCIPLLRQISTTITNKIGALNEVPNNDKNAHHQPLLSTSFIIWKMRWGVDKRGARYGLRIMYCVNGKHVVFANIKHKKEIKDDENDFQAETLERLKYFFSYEYK